MKILRIFAASSLLFSGAAFAAEQAGDSMAVNLFKVLFGLLVVLAMMAGAAWLLKRFGVAKAAGGGTVKIIGGVSVGHRERVMVIEVADQWIVVGVAPGCVNSLATMARQEIAVPSVSSSPAAANFASWLKQTIEKRNAK